MSAGRAAAEDSRKAAAAGPAPSNAKVAEPGIGNRIPVVAELRRHDALGGSNRVGVTYFNPAHPRNRAERRAAAKLTRGGRK